jgi:2-keto-4-pentenoate hydratase
MPVYEGGFAAIEAEVVLELGCDVPHVERDFTDEELADLISAAYCGAEIASSPMAVVNQRGATSVIADLGNNKGVIVGPEIPGWRAKAPNSLSVVVTVDDQVVGNATLESIATAPLQALRFLVNHCARHDIMLPAGILVSSGALTGVHDVEIASVARIDYGKLGNFDVTFEPLLGGAVSSVRRHGL